MSNELALELKVKNLEATVAKIKREMLLAGADVEKNFTKKTESGVSRIGSAFTKLKNLIGAAFVASGIVAFTRSLITLGSELDESQSKFNAVFGDSAKQFEQDLIVMGDAIGRGTLELKQYTSAIGNLLQPLGFAKEGSAQFSKEITKLAIDLASFNNVSDQQAIDAMTKALLGEREALKGIGLAISEAEVAERSIKVARENGLVATDQATRALATYEIMVEKTKNSHGDAQRTAGSFANQLKRLQGIIKDTLAESGLDLSQQTAGVLETIGQYIQTYGKAMFSVLIEIGKAIGDFFGTVASVVYDTFEAFGISLENGGEQGRSFGALLITVLNGLVAVIQAAGFMLRNFVALAIAVVKDMVGAFAGGVALISGVFDGLAEVVVMTMVAVGNNIIAGVQKGVNGAINAINSLIDKANSLTGVSIFGKIGNVAQLEMKSVSNSVSGGFAKISQASAKFSQDFGSNTSQARANMQTDFASTSAKVVASINATNSKIKKSGEGNKSIYDANLKSVAELAKGIDGVGSSGESAGNKAGGGAKTAKKETEDRGKKVKALQDDYKKFEDKLKDIEKVTEDIEKSSDSMNKTIAEGMKKVSQEITKVRSEYEKTLQSINDSEQNNLESGVEGFARSQIEKEKALQENYNAITAELDEQLTIENNQERVNELYRERARIQAELLQVQENIKSIDQDRYSTLLQEERTRAGLNDLQKELYDFQANQQSIQDEAENARRVAEEKYLAEVERLEKQQKIYELFDNLQNVSSKELLQLQKDERLQKLSEEEQELFNKLLSERIQYQTLTEDKIRMEKSLAFTIKSLQDNITTSMKANLDSLSADYRKLIAEMQQALSIQNSLNSFSIGQRYKGGPVEAGTPYFVGENPDGSLNRTSELFIPRQSGTIANAQQVQDAIRSMTSNVDNSRKIEATINSSTGSQDIMRQLQKILFRL